MVATYGREAPGATIVVDYLGSTVTVTADDAGWWLFAAPSRDEDTMPVTV